MRAAECFADGDLDRFRLEIVREHVRPCDGLQHSPMTARRTKQRDDQ